MLANQLIEGNVSGALFENFLRKVLRHLRESIETRDKDIVVFMDNAKIHKHPLVLQCAAKYKAHLLFNS